ncbi:MAG TPA: histidinol-phosphate transaminase [Cytophagaceae bacterium]|nr:histidinol-phosphate transaminase [Cytophagaceae bacterium]
MFNINNILRENIKKTKPYSSARDEYNGHEGIFLDANENPIGSVTKENFNRYPDPLQKEVKERLSELKRVKPSQIFLGNGSDEAIDLLFRAVCVPGADNVITMPPTYGMYEVSANINDIRIKEVPLSTDFEIQADKVLAAVDAHTKMIFVCSPNNPTGNSMNPESVEKILRSFNGLVAIDEAYIDFAQYKSFIGKLDQYPNLVVLQTFSKAWGLAALRLGIAYASEEIIAVINKIKPPYNINQLTQELALEALGNVLKKEGMVAEILFQRTKLVNQLSEIKTITKIYPSDANFVLIKTADGKKLYDFLVSKKIITRDRSKVILCEGCVRITVGTKEENDLLIKAIQEYKN